MASSGPLKQSLGMLHPAANRHPKATHQWLLMGVGSLPFASPSTLKTLQTLQTLQTLKTLKTLTWHEQAPQAHTSMASSGPLKQSLGMLHPAANRAPQGHTSMASYGRPSLPFASPSTLKTLQTLQTLKNL